MKLDLKNIKSNLHPINLGFLIFIVFIFSFFVSSSVFANSNYGTDNQIPFMNSGGTDFDYSSNFIFDGTDRNLFGGSILTSPVNTNHNLKTTLTRFSSTQSLFQNSLTSTESANMDLIVRYIPKGTGGRTAYQVWGGSDLANEGYLEFSHLGNGIQFKSNKSGTGSIVPIDFLMGSTSVMQLSTTNQLIMGVGILPDTDNGAYLGSNTLGFNNLFLSANTKISWDASNATLTHSNNLLTSNVDIVVPDEVYGSDWNSSLEIPTKNAVYDKLEALSIGAVDDVLLSAVSSDPVDPSSGQSVIWSSDGIGSGDPGDLMAKVTVGGITKILTIVDYSQSTLGSSITPTTEIAILILTLLLTFFGFFSLTYLVIKKIV